MLAILAPGQGAQTPGFLVPWLDVPGVAERVGTLGELAGVDLVAAGTTGTAEEIRDTAVTQPLLVAAGVAVAEALTGDGPLPARAVAGHSIGEFTAAVLAGALPAATAMALVRERGVAMADASATTPTGMAAVLGGVAATVLTRLDELGLTPANVNGAGQVVAAGPVAALEQLLADPPDGARVRRLDVAGAFHTSYMAPARERLATLAAQATPADPAIPLVSNADGAEVGAGAELLRRLVAQVAAPVRWDTCMETLTRIGVTAVVELPPAGTLTGLARRAMPGVETLALRSPADLDAARRLLAAHAAPTTEAGPGLRLVVAPLAGTFRALPVPPGTPVLAGAPVGSVVSHRSETPVQAPHGGVLVEWLAQDGDPVGAGQPLVTLHGEESA